MLSLCRRRLQVLGVYFRVSIGFKFCFEVDLVHVIFPPSFALAQPTAIADAQGLSFFHDKRDDFILRHRVALAYGGGKRQHIKRQCFLWHLA